MSVLNELFSTFDEMCSKYNIEKIKTIGDAYIAVGGLTHNPIKNHADAMVSMALEMSQSSVLQNNCLGVKLKLRIGLASGPVIAGVRVG